MKSYVQILTTPTADTAGTTLLVHFDSKRYLIGSLGEGTQRACVQMGARLLKLSECFVTGKSVWANTGGLIGMVLTLADASASSVASSQVDGVARAMARGKRLGLEEDGDEMGRLLEEAKKEGSEQGKLTFFGPKNLNHMLATARRFVFRKGLPVNVHEVRPEGCELGADKMNVEGEDEWAPYWADDNVKVWAMAVSPESSSQNNGSGSRQTGTVSPRKRSIEEVHDDNATPKRKQLAVANDLSPAQRDQLTAKAVVSEMFNSTWRLDTLHETPLCRVKLPATIFIRDLETNKIVRYEGPLPDGRKPLPDPNLTVLVRRPWPGALVESLPPTEPSPEAVSYIFKNHKQRGKFDGARAKQLKVEGRDRGLLAKGQEVKNADGETITPDMVLGEAKDGGGLAVVDLPNPSYIEPLLARPEWREKTVMAGVGAVVWICGEGVATDERIQSFMKEFSDLEHIISSSEYCPNSLTFNSATTATVRQGKVDPKRYRVPVHDSETENGAQLYGGSSAYKDQLERHPLPKNAHIARRGQVIQLEPSFHLQKEEAVPPLFIPGVEKEMSQEVLDEAVKAREAIEASRADHDAWAQTVPDKDAEIITLGTGSALPSKYRNVSATLLRLPGWGNVLFDCGENTLGQLKRIFPPDEMRQVLRDLRLIFISHMHADHHLGTAAVVQAWYHEVHGGVPAPPRDPSSPVTALFSEDQPPRLAVVSEPAMAHWLHEYSSVEDIGLSRIATLVCSAAQPHKNRPSDLTLFVPPHHLRGLSPAARTDNHAAHRLPPAALGLADIQTVAVRHCHNARAVSITFPSGFKASYSGDCRPSRDFARIGKGSTVCIHEATFDDELQGDAEAKNHSTTSEALRVAQDMGSRACVLTHFSQRYQKLPVLEHGAGGSENETQDLAVTTAATEAPDNDLYASTNPADEMAAPLDDVAETVTMPDQTGSASSGKKYDLPVAHTTKGPAHHRGDSKPLGRSDSGGAPEAVKFKLTSDMKVAVAFDYMRVKMGEIAEMQAFTPALLKLFAEEDGKEEGVEEEGVGGGKGVGKKEVVKGKGGRQEKNGKGATLGSEGKQGKQISKGKQENQSKREKRRKAAEERGPASGGVEKVEDGGANGQ